MRTKRQILDGVFYQLKNGCNWEDLPKDLLPYSIVFWHYKQWRKDGVFDEIQQALHVQVRECVQKTVLDAMLINDPQALKNTCTAGTESTGFCHYKYTNGIKRHLAVDS